MKIFVRASSLVIKGSAYDVLQQLRELAQAYPHTTLQEYIEHRLS